MNRVEGKKHPWERPWSFGWGQMRVGSVIRRELGNDELDRWYAAVGSAFFDDGVKTHVPEVHAEVLDANGFDPGIVEHAIADPTTIDDVRADHDFAAATYGAHGVPTIVTEAGDADVRAGGGTRADRRRRGRALGARAGRWRASRTCTSCATRRPTTTSCTSREQFETYLTTRDWNTVENPAP